MKLWLKVMKNTKIIKDTVIECSDKENYQANLKVCITTGCEKLDIPKPYWLPSNLTEYNTFNKSTFTEDNFMEEIDFDKLVIAEIDVEKK